MSRSRFRIVFVLLVLILLVASVLFALLTYWLDAGGAAEPGTGQGDMGSSTSLDPEALRLPPLPLEDGRIAQVMDEAPSPAM
jgi:hypothetical protein